jgi:cytochrome c-type biogenesis protein CcmE
VARKSSPARLVIALSVAAVLAVFLLYTSIAGGGTPSVKPSDLAGRSERVTLAGRVVGPVSGDPHGAGLSFRLRDPGAKGASTTVAVLYKGSKSDMFKVGRDLTVEGALKNGTFVAVPGSMVTKCPSKYTAASG